MIRLTVELKADSYGNLHGALRDLLLMVEDGWSVFEQMNNMRFEKVSADVRMNAELSVLPGKVAEE